MWVFWHVSGYDRNHVESSALPGNLDQACHFLIRFILRSWHLANAFCSDTEPSGGAISRTDDGWQAVIRLEGIDVSVRDRMTSLKSTSAVCEDVAGLEKQASEAFWRDWRDISMISEDAEQVYRLSVTPSCAPKIASSILKAYDLELGFDWMGGLIWVGGKGADLGHTVRETIQNLVSCNSDAGD